jgi:DHA2 family multidrug resistance protein
MTSGLSFHQLVWPQLALGPAMPFFFIPIMSLAMATLTPSELAGGAGLLNFVRTTAGAFATSLTTTSWTNSATVTRTAFVGRLNGADNVINGIQATGASHNQALGMLDNIIQSQAVMLATNHVFLGISVLMVISVSAVWLAPKPAPGSMGGRPAGGH